MVMDSLEDNSMGMITIRMLVEEDRTGTSLRTMEKSKMEAEEDMEEGEAEEEAEAEVMDTLLREDTARTGIALYVEVWNTSAPDAQSK